MSEDVRIVQFGSMPEYQLPDWATEKTLDKIRGSLEKDLDLTEDTKRVLNNIFEEIKKTKTISSQQLKEMTSAKSASGKANKAAKELDNLYATTDYAATGTKQLGRATHDTAKSMGSTMKMLFASKMAILPALYAIQRHGRKLISDYTSTTTMFKTMYNSGVQYEGTVVDLRTKLAASGTSVEQFGQLMDKYGAAINRTGVDGFYRMNREMERLGNSIKESRFILADYGLTHQEAAEFHASYLEQQRVMGGLRAIDERKLRLGMEQQIKTMSALTKLTNKSREELLEGQLQAKGDPDITRMLMSMSPEHAAAVGEALGQGVGALQAAGFADQLPKFKDMVASLVPEASASYNELMEANQVEMALFLAGMARDTRAGRVTSSEDIIYRLTNELAPVLTDAYRTGRFEAIAVADPASRELANQSAVSLRNLHQSMDNIQKYLGPDGKIDIEAMAKARNAELTAMTEFQSMANRASETVILGQLKFIEDALGDPEIGLAARIQQLTDVLGFGVEKLNAIFNISPDDAKESMSYGARAAVLGVGLGMAGTFGALFRAVMARIGLVAGGAAGAMGPLQGDMFGDVGGGSRGGPRRNWGRIGRFGVGGGIAVAGQLAGMGGDYFARTAKSESASRGANLLGGIAEGALTGGGLGLMTGNPVIAGLAAIGGGLYGAWSATKENQGGSLRQMGEIPTGVDRRANELFNDEAQKSQINMTRNIEKSNEQLTAMNRNIQRLYEEVATIKSLYRAEVASGGGLAKTQG